MVLIDRHTPSSSNEALHLTSKFASCHHSIFLCESSPDYSCQRHVPIFPGFFFQFWQALSQCWSGSMLSCMPLHSGP